MDQHKPAHNSKWKDFFFFYIYEKLGSNLYSDDYVSKRCDSTFDFSPKK